MKHVRLVVAEIYFSFFYLSIFNKGTVVPTHYILPTSMQSNTQSLLNFDAEMILKQNQIFAKKKPCLHIFL